MKTIAIAIIAIALSLTGCGLFDEEDWEDTPQAWELTVTCDTPSYWRVSGDFVDEGWCPDLHCVERTGVLIATPAELARQDVTRDFACWPSRQPGGSAMLR